MGRYTRDKRSPKQLAAKFHSPWAHRCLYDFHAFPADELEYRSLTEETHNPQVSTLIEPLFSEVCQEVFPGWRGLSYHSIFFTMRWLSGSGWFRGGFHRTDR
jgi:hypothetical protein